MVSGAIIMNSFISIGCCVAATALFHLVDAGDGAPLEWRIVDGGNGHFYEHVDAGMPISWHEARRLAGYRSHKGLTGHLLTVTSPQEWDFVTSRFLNDSGLDWLGSFQDTSAVDFGEPAGGWRWVTGEPWGFTAWSTPNLGGNDDEPNDHGG